jgi:hypothetical protein
VGKSVLKRYAEKKNEDSSKSRPAPVEKKVQPSSQQSKKQTIHRKGGSTAEAKAAKVASRAHRFVEQEPTRSEDGLDSETRSLEDLQSENRQQDHLYEEEEEEGRYVVPTLPTMPKSPLVPPTKSQAQNQEEIQSWRVGLPRPVSAPGWNKKLRPVDQAIFGSSGEMRSKSLNRPTEHGALYSPPATKLPSSQAAAALRGTRSEEKYQSKSDHHHHHSEQFLIPETQEEEEDGEGEERDENRMQSQRHVKSTASNMNKKSSSTSQQRSPPLQPQRPEDDLDVYEDKVMSIFSNSRHMLAGRLHVFLLLYSFCYLSFSPFPMW